jgi:hypothetical protein
MNAHEAILLACLSLAAVLGLQTPYVTKLDWGGTAIMGLIPERWTVPLCTGVDIGVDCVLPDKPAVD